MKKTLLLLTFLCISAAWSQAQNSFKFGILGGTSTYDVSPSELLVRNNADEETIKLAFDDANFGLHFGIFVLAKSDFLFIKPQLQFNSQTVTYKLEDLRSGEVNLFNETYQNIDIPLQLGVVLGPVRLGVGPVGHVHINGSSEINNGLNIDYEQKFKEMTFGYILGIGVDIWNFHLDAGYEGNFSHLGSHMNFFGKEIKFDDSPSRFIFTIGVSF